MEAYQAFKENPALAEAMKSAGVTEKPHVLILNEVGRGSL